MSPPLTPLDRLQPLFERRVCWMLAPLAQALDYALITVRRLLKQAGYCRSYTHNGKWYTLRTTPAFNRAGLWHYQDIGFSQQGSLTATIRHLVEQSPAGLAAREISQKLQHPCHPVLTQMHRNHQLDRIPVAGEFRYLSTLAALNRRQRERIARAAPPSGPTALSTAAAVLVLVEYIKHPARSFEQLADHLQQQRELTVTPEQIDQLFQAHDLKKTPPIPTSGS
jgi:hypothetical protein